MFDPSVTAPGGTASQHEGDLTRLATDVSTSSLSPMETPTMLKYRWRSCAALAFVLTLNACTAPDPAERGVAWTVSEDPVLRIGGYDGRPGHQLYRVLDAVRLSSGGLAIATLSGTDIRYFDGDGQLLAIAGGSGSGPAEFQRLQAIGRAGDTVLVLTGDPAIGWIAPDGRVIRKELLRGGTAYPRCRTGVGRQLLLADGRLLTAHRPGPSTGCPGGPPPGSDQDSIIAVLRDPVSGMLESLGVFPPEDRSAAGWVPFGNIVLFAATADYLYVGSSHSDSIAVFDLHGRRMGAWRVDIGRIPISSEVRSKAGQGQARIPAHYPFIGHLIGDGAGNLWVLGYPPLDVPIPSHALTMGAIWVETPDSFDWTVLAPSGDVIARVRTPSRWQILEIGADAIVVLEHDSLEVETVSAYRLNKPG